VPRDDDEIRERRRVEAEKARSREYWRYSMGVLRPAGFLAIATLFGVGLLVAGPTVERRLVGLAVTLVGLALARPVWHWYQRRKQGLVDPPHLQNEFPLRRGELLAIAFMFGALGLLTVTTGSAALGAVLVITAVGVCVYAWRT
jgi:hypothetical protein